MQDGSEHYAPCKPGKPHIRVEEYDADDEAYVVENRAYRIDEEAPLKLRDAREEIGDAEEYRLQKHDAHEERNVMRGACIKTGKERDDKPWSKEKGQRTQDDDEHEKCGKYGIEEAPRGLFAFLPPFGKERDEHRKRDHGCTPDEDEVGEAECGIVDIEHLPRAEIRRKQSVAQKPEELGKEREEAQKISGLMESAYLSFYESEKLRNHTTPRLQQSSSVFLFPLPEGSCASRESHLPAGRRWQTGLSLP